MPASAWTATLETGPGTVVAFVSTMGATSMSFPLNAPAEVQTTFDLQGDDGKALVAQLAKSCLTDPSAGPVYLRLSENGTVRFLGVIADVQAELSEEQTLSTRFVDFAGPYEQTATYVTIAPYTLGSYSQCVTGPVRYPRLGNTTVSSIISDLIAPDTGQSYPLNELTRSGTVSTSAGISPEGASVLDVLKQLADTGLLDWYVEAPSTIKIGDPIGTDKTDSVKFVLGPRGVANVLSANVQYLPPVNWVFVKSDNGAVSSPMLSDDAGATFISDVAASQGSYGTYDMTVQNETGQGNTDLTLAVDAFRPDWRRIYDVVLDPSICPRPWTDWYLGDTVQVDLGQSALPVAPLTVNRIDIALNDQLIEEAITVSFEDD